MCAERSANKGAGVWVCLVLESSAQEVRKAGAEMKANRGAEVWACLALER